MKQMTVLLVDDEVGFVEALAERLSLRGFDTSVAFDVQTALNTLATNLFDAIVLDLRLPDGNGIDILRIIREKYPDARVLMLTGHGSDDERRICMELGAAAFINKPINADKLAYMLHDEGEDA